MVAIQRTSARDSPLLYQAEAAPQKAAGYKLRAVSPDVFIVGAGPAGLASAIALAARGIDVQVVDGVRPPVEKACGEGLLPHTLAALRDLGISLPDLSVEHARIEGIRFIDSLDGTSSEASFRSSKGAGLKRTILHQLLLNRAESLGVQVKWQTVVKSITRQQSSLWPRSTRPVWCSVETNRGTVHPHFIIGADGSQSRIRVLAGLNRASAGTRRVGLRQHFSIAPWTEFVEVYWSRHGQAYVTPVSSGQVCVAFVASEKPASLLQALGHFPQLQRRLLGALHVDAPRSAVTRNLRLRQISCGNLALVGDASGSVDAVTGEGLSLCFRQALALADSIANSDSKNTADSFAEYRKAHAAMRRLPAFMANTMLKMDRSDLIRHCALATLRRSPKLFALLLAAHIGEARPAVRLNTNSLADRELSAVNHLLRS